MGEGKERGWVTDSSPSRLLELLFFRFGVGILQSMPNATQFVHGTYCYRVSGRVAVG